MGNEAKEDNVGVLNLYAGSRPFFAVIIPVYNKEQHVAKAIDSVLRQTYKNFELIIVCDPSDDQSKDKVYQFNDPRIQVFQRDQPGPGGYAARNLGMRNATAPWITFLDADDEWFLDRLAYHKSLIDRTNLKVICSSWRDVYENGSESTAARLLEEPLSASKFFKVYRKESRVVCTNTITFHKTIFDAIGGFPENRYARGGDVSTWVRIIDYAGEVYRSTRETAYYNKSNSTVTKAIDPSISHNAVYEMCVEISKRRRMDPLYRLTLAKLSNKHLRYGLVCRIKKGEIRISDLKYYSFWANPLSYVSFLFLSMLPDMFIRNVVIKVLKIKNYFRRIF